MTPTQLDVNYWQIQAEQRDMAMLYVAIIKASGGFFEEPECGLPEGAGKYAGKPYNGTRNPESDFINAKGNSTLARHLEDHGAALGVTSEQSYLSNARNFLQKPPTPTTQSFVSSEGTYFRYDTATNEFGIINQYGGISTYFKPDTGLSYWLDQISKYVPK